MIESYGYRKNQGFCLFGRIGAKRERSCVKPSHT
nr:MAG TPA: hypothetical protein [Caudoviricetes sp.]